MKKPIFAVKIIILLWLLCLLGIFVFAQVANKKTGIEKIDKYSKTLDSFIEKNKSPHLVFADVSQSEKPKWKKFESEKAFNKFQETSVAYSISYNWQKNGKIVVSNFILSSESGDWFKYVYLYFCEDGTLVKAKSQLNTFYGNFNFLQDIYFDEKGHILKDTLTYLDLYSKKPKNPDESDILVNGDRMNPFYFKTTNQLPYNHLLKD
ncbi:MAG: hypothetical protein ACR2J3_01540 [Aridibacter sp.]